MSKFRSTLAITGALAAAVALAACSSPSGSMGGMDRDGSSTPSATPTDAGAFVDQDVTFASMMVPHHEQAIEMADAILTKDGIDPRVVELATNIKAAQGPEIETMNSWIDAWGSDGGMSGMDHGSGDGMMSDSDMAGLDSATGTDAQRLFLEGMTMHHEGAIVMAETEVKSGKNPDAIALAKKIITDQKAEIDTMKDILASL